MHEGGGESQTAASKSRENPSFELIKAEQVAGVERALIEEI